MRVGCRRIVLYGHPGRVPPTGLITRRLYTDSRESKSTNDTKKSFFERLRIALDRTKVEWYPIPVGLGLGVVAFVQIKNMREREIRRQVRETDSYSKDEVKPTGGWSVFVYSTLPFRPLSRLWGKFNEITLPEWFRIPGFKLYSWIFGVNLSEVGETDLRKYRNLAEFFYRELKPGARPIDENATLISPADGTVLHFGRIIDRRVEQVKGMTYSLDALLGGGTTDDGDKKIDFIDFGEKHDQTKDPAHTIDAEAEFANVNGISYTIDTLLGSDQEQRKEAWVSGKDASLPMHQRKSTVERIRKDLEKRKFWQEKIPTDLYFCVVYLAPGDYHRFHSPANWVVERRRHFAGELYSVSPFLQKRLSNLFVLNERVALLGRWRYGFFSMTPVGATNVGGIKIHFDRELRTNTLTSDKPKTAYAEATYAKASQLLGGQPLRRGEQVGGFNLGSTIVLVFEAPKSFEFLIKENQRIKMGEAVGIIK